MRRHAWTIWGWANLKYAMRLKVPCAPKCLEFPITKQRKGNEASSLELARRGGGVDAAACL